MKTIEVTIYNYNELSDKAKEKARDNYLTNWMHDDWSDCTIDFMKEEGQHRYGFEIKEIRFSGFWSQGDGASWCGMVNLRHWIDKTFNTTDKEHPLTQIFLALLDEGWITEQVSVSYNSSHYCHENTMDVANIDHYYKIDDESVMEMGQLKGANVADLISMVGGHMDDMYERLESDCKAFAREIYRALEEDYEASTSEETIANIYNESETYFHENGAIA